MKASVAVSSIKNATEVTMVISHDKARTPGTGTKGISWVLIAREIGLPHAALLRTHDLHRAMRTTLVTTPDRP
jgi:hypothetical protein